MNYIKFNFIAFTLLILTGCGQKVVGLNPTGYANQYEIEVEGNTGFSQPQAIKMKAVEEAKNKCKELGKNYHKISEEFIPAGFAIWPKATLKFECNNNLIPTEQKILIMDSNSLSKKIEELDKLYNSKLITKEEYDKKRNELLDNF